MQTLLAKPTQDRNFVSNDFKLTDWDSIRPYFETLLEMPVERASDLAQLIADLDELGAIVDEDVAWRYIRMTCDTQNEAHAQSYQFFVQEIAPQLAEVGDKLNRKVATSPYWNSLDMDKYKNYYRQLQTEIKLFRAENIPLFTEEQTLTHTYSGIMGKMTITHEDKILTLQQAAKLLENRDRSLREQIWRKVAERRLQDAERLDELFDKLVAIRHQIAQNAGFESYTDYKYAALGRFDYTRQDCLSFHQAIAECVTPYLAKLTEERKARLGLDSIRPWDTAVDIFGETALTPFEGGAELVQKSINVLSQLKPELGDMVGLMRELGYLDVESRIGKAPGGYNYPLAESGVPFIFMNAANAQSDVTTMLHEAGHAVHSFVTRPISFKALRRTPAEVAEVASMSMELLTLDFYPEFYPDPTDCKRAQKEQILRSLTAFPWIATVDAFQHWIYDNPQHSSAERKAKWNELYLGFQGTEMDWTGLEHIRQNLWHRQLHIFELPFYYIEYAFAQLAAIAIWRNYKQNPTQALNDYLQALSLGYTRTIPELYAAAGISFDCSVGYVRELADFCWEAYQEVNP